MQCTMTTMSASRVFALVDGGKKTTWASASCTVSRSSWAQVYRSGMQQTNAACTTLMQILPLCYLHLVAASRSYACAQDDLDTVQLVLVVFFPPSASSNSLLALMEVIVHCNLRWWCFPWSPSAFTNVLTNECAQIATCTVWWFK